MTHPIVRAGFQLLAMATLLLILLIAYIGFAESRGESRAREFCGSLVVGGSTELLLERALKMGADHNQTLWIRHNNEESWLPVTFTGATPLSRHICTVYGEQRISRFHYAYLD